MLIELTVLIPTTADLLNDYDPVETFAHQKPSRDPHMEDAVLGPILKQKALTIPKEISFATVRMTIRHEIIIGIEQSIENPALTIYSLSDGRKLLTQQPYELSREQFHQNYLEELAEYEQTIEVTAKPLNPNLDIPNEG